MNCRSMAERSVATRTTEPRPLEKLDKVHQDLYVDLMEVDGRRASSSVSSLR